MKGVPKPRATQRNQAFCRNLPSKWMIRLSVDGQSVIIRVRAALK